MRAPSLNVVPAKAGIHTPRPIVERCCWQTCAKLCFPSPREAAGRDQGWGGAANTAVSEYADRPPTPDPSPPRADARGGRGEESEFNFQITFSNSISRSRGAMRPKFCKNLVPLQTEGAGKAGCPMHPQPRVYW